MGVLECFVRGMEIGALVVGVIVALLVAALIMAAICMLLYYAFTIEPELMEATEHERAGEHVAGGTSQAGAGDPGRVRPDHAARV